jgi:D-glycero-D-manno-heptose 1,7-bisphosphate phosphatase
MNKCVFLDRDGVINPLVYNPLTNDYESPHRIEDFSVFPYVGKALKLLQANHYNLFLISNQPSYAKGKTSLDNIYTIQTALDTYLQEHGIIFTAYYYCYHHPAGIVPEYTQVCDCRKPKSKFLVDAQAEFALDYRSSWLIGDQDSDVECGQSQGLQSIQIENVHSVLKRGKSTPTYKVNNLLQAVEIIINKQ